MKKRTGEKEECPFLVEIFLDSKTRLFSEKSATNVYHHGLEVTSEGVGATRGRTTRVMRKKGRIQACVHRLFLASPGVASNGGV